MTGLTPLVILGPTASGKSDVAMAVARRHAEAEIVAVDAMQVYRRMDIGTAKPSAADRQAVVHHCLDLVDASDLFTVADFAGAARQALTEIAARSHRAVLVAGTGLYLRSVTDQMEVPGRWPDVRAELDARVTAEGVEALHRQLGELDPTAAAKMEAGNVRRVVRALEVTIGSGRPFSSYGPGIDVYPAVPFIQLGLQWPRPILAGRIAERVHRMIDSGLVAEVESLADSPISRTARQALGYKEILDVLSGACSLEAAIETIVTRTRQFAVRQERWFRRDPRIRWIAIDDDPVATALPVLERAWQTSN
ncbi:MAG: tRNA (adenosine(37)-N6)-dimethylallyltransferase MiaA [Ilumatobacteraceae bacterium]